MTTMVYVFIVDPDTSQKKTIHTLNLRHISLDLPNVYYSLDQLDSLAISFRLSKTKYTCKIFKNLEIWCCCVLESLANARKQGKTQNIC